MDITNKIKYVGVSDYDIDLFESQYPVPDGITYNSYVILDSKIAVIDTVDIKFRYEWLDNLQNALEGKKPDFLVVQHMEPDHSANIMNLLTLYPEIKIVASDKAFYMMKNFFGTDFADNRIVVKEGDTLQLGENNLKFISAPMVHWPEVIMTYETNNKILFSADAFGKFGGFDKSEDWAKEARRYYINIVGKYGPQVQNLLKKAAGIEIKTICPLHGPVLFENIDYYINLYDIWSFYKPEQEGVLIAYTSVYGNTARAVIKLAEKLKNMYSGRVEIYDLSRADMSAVVADAFRFSKLVLATTTYNTSIFPSMREFILTLKEHNFCNRKVAFIENGSWAPMATKQMKNMLEGCKGLEFPFVDVKILASLDRDSTKDINTLVEQLCYGFGTDPKQGEINQKALFNIGYGLYVVTANDNGRDNGIIVNTVTQLTNTPNRVAVTINKSNYSHHIIKQNGKMNINCLTTETPFSIFERFGFQSGRNTDKFEGMTITRSQNGLAVLDKYINALISLSVENYIDLDTHGMFICTVTEMKKLSDNPTMTYTYYQDNVKPKPQKTEKKGYICRICGYVYEGETLPEDFICPICKHGASDFEKIQ